jgi:hypothetical protein
MRCRGGDTLQNAMERNGYAEKVYDGPEAEATLIQLALERSGIASFVDTNTAFNRHLHGVVFVLDKGQVSRAQEIVDRFLKRAAVSEAVLSPAWWCSSCGETVEGQFEACWKCGAAKT